MNGRCLRLVALALVLGGAGCGPASLAASEHGASTPQRVNILGYQGQAMEPFISRDGRYLLFNNLNDPAVNTNLHVAERIDDLNFRYRGELQGVNSAALEGAVSLDRDNNLYFISPRSYEQSLSTIYRGRLQADGMVSDVTLVAGVSLQQPGMVNFDAEISSDGKLLYFVDARFGSSGPETADLTIAERQGDGFERLANSAQILARVNSDEALEYAPCLSADGTRLYFTRAHRSLWGSDVAIYLARRQTASDPFGEPQRLTAITGFSEGPALAPDEGSLYFHRQEAGVFVIYRLPLTSP